LFDSNAVRMPIIDERVPNVHGFDTSHIDYMPVA